MNRLTAKIIRSSAIPYVRHGAVMGCKRFFELAFILAAFGTTSGCQRPAQKLPSPPQFAWKQPGMTSSGAPQIAPLPVSREDDLEHKIVPFSGADTVLFGQDSSDLSLDAQSILDAQAQWLIQHPDVSVRVEGHAGDRKAREYSFALGERRASVVRLFLISRGVARSRIAVSTLGKERPASVVFNGIGWEQNRRAQSVMLYPGR